MTKHYQNIMESDQIMTNCGQKLRCVNSLSEQESSFYKQFAFYFKPKLSCFAQIDVQNEYWERMSYLQAFFIENLMINFYFAVVIMIRYFDTASVCMTSIITKNLSINYPSENSKFLRYWLINLKLLVPPFIQRAKNNTYHGL